MKIRVVVHEAKERGYWAAVPALQGCFSEGETLRELRRNFREALGDMTVLRRRFTRVSEPDLGPSLL
jgi:predicted RNase H-like HicB family nuclease